MDKIQFTFKQFDVNNDSVVIDGVTIPIPKGVGVDPWRKFWDKVKEMQTPSRTRWY